MRAAGTFVWLGLAGLLGCGGGPSAIGGRGDAGARADAAGAGAVDAAGAAWDGNLAPADAAAAAACATRITYGSAWIHPQNHPAQYDDATGHVTWDGVCHADGKNSYAVLSNGWRPYFSGPSSCIIALDVSGDCAAAPPKSCTTRIHYGTSWLAPPGHTARYDDVNGVVTWDGACAGASGGNSQALLSNGWAPHFSGAGSCWMSFRHEQCGGLFTNAVLAQGCADPGVVWDGSRYVMVCTSGNAAAAFPMRTSPDLVHWHSQGHIFPSGSRPSWATGDFWAPEIHKVGAHWVAYFSARDSDGTLAVGAATADNPLGPYTDLGHPLVHTADPGDIDASEFQAPDGTHYLLWKIDGNSSGKHTPIRIQKLGQGGVTLQGSPTTLITNDESWEGAVVEGPWMIHQGSYFYLFYSGNSYASTAYAIGVARATSPTGPFAKLGAPILTSNAAWSGPGHCSVVRGPGGEWVLVYHAWVAGHVGSSPGRLPLVDRVSFRNGWPHMDSAPSPRSQPLP